MCGFDALHSHIADMGTYYGTVRSLGDFFPAAVDVPKEECISIEPLSKPVETKYVDGEVWHKFTGPMKVDGVTFWRRAREFEAAEE